MGGAGAVVGPLGWLPPRVSAPLARGGGTPPAHRRGLALRTPSCAAAPGEVAAQLRAGAPAEGRE